jgi:putative oxidoreductase
MHLLNRLAPHVHWGLRLSLAASFLYHGLGKYPVAEFAKAFEMPVLLAWIVAIVEVGAAVCLIVGAFGREMLTRMAGLIVVVIMIGAIVMVHGKNGFSVFNNGFEFQLLMMLTGLYFVARGNQV